MNLLDIKKNLLGPFLIFSVFFQGLAFGSVQMSPTEGKVIIKKVELENTKGEWISVIQPDSLVDLVTTEPRISLLNRGRVPTGDYRNFRITFLDGNHSPMDEKSNFARSDKEDIFELYSPQGFITPFQVRQNSFISVSFLLQLQDMIRNATVDAVTITVDNRTEKIFSDKLKLIF